MKRSLAILSLSILSLSLAFGQSEPSEESVLQQARDAFAADSVVAAQDAAATDSSAADSATDTEAADSGQAEAESDNPYTPFLIQFVPGIGFPFGMWDSSFAAGLVGCAVGDLEGAMGASVFAIADNVLGVQGAGVFCIAGRIEGAQGAAVFTMASELVGVQASGVFNMASTVEGVQASGVFNMADAVVGVQASGVFNMASSVVGVQASSCLNMAGKVEGLMIGLVNIADECDGLAIGLVNIIGNGLHDWGLSWDASSGYLSLSYETGTDAFYTLLYGGIPSRSLGESFDDLIVGIGLGTRLAEADGFWLDLDISSEQLIADPGMDRWRSLIDGYPVLRLSAGCALLGELQLYGGVWCGFDLPGHPYPERLRGDWGWSGRVFGLAYAAYPTLFFGLKI